MPKMKVHKTKDYTVMSNYHLRDKRLSLKAKGLLSVMLSLPDSWDYSLKGLVMICKEGETAVDGALKELKLYKYVKVDKLKPSETGSGRYEYIYNIYEVPQEGCFQGLENQPLENLGLENHPLNKYTKELNTKELIINKLNINQSILRKDVEKLIEADTFNDDRLDEIVNIILEILNSKKEYMKISGNEISISTVKGAFINLESDHIDYVLDSLDKCTSDIKNIKAYIIACLYNSTLTINNYYKQRVNYELGGR